MIYRGLRARGSACAIVVVVVAAFSSCYGPTGLKATSYGNVHFLGSGTCYTVTISADPSPTKIQIVFPDGQKLDVSAISKSAVTSIFGPPQRSDDFPGEGKFEQFSMGKCVISFVKDEFAGLEADAGIKIVNVSNGKSVTLPATESDVRSVFGKPTKIEYLRSQQP